MPTLLIVGEDGAERTVELTGHDLKIGRAPENDVVLPDQTKGVSRLHAELRYENNQYVIVDLNSQNGTWVDGQRVQRGQFAPNAEIQIGPYRLTMREAPPVASPFETQIVRAPAFEPEMPTPVPTMVTQSEPRDTSGPARQPEAPAAAESRGPSVVPPLPPAAEARPRPGPGSRAPSKPGQVPARSGRARPLLIASLFVGAAVAIVLGLRFVSRPALTPTSVTSPANPKIGDVARTPRPTPPAEAAAANEAAVAEPSPTGAAAPTPAGDAPGSGGPSSTGAAADTGSAVSAPVVQASSPPTPGPSPALPAGSTATYQEGGRPARGRASAPTRTDAAARGGSNPAPSVARRPGEAPQAWRSRVAALQTKYASANVALARGEFATAAAGFEAILKDEPGYLDAPQLLARAREGQQASARDAFEAGNRLDVAGDWVAALQKYDLARQIDPSLAGLDDAARRARERMRAAGVDAFKRARQYDALGRSTEAIKEYEKAAQWLPSEDLNRRAARDRADQLKAGPK